MTSDSKPREFWIDEYDDRPNATRIRDGVAQTIPHGAIHVIEYSAYEALKAELASVKKHYEKMFDDLLHSKGKK